MSDVPANVHIVDDNRELLDALHEFFSTMGIPSRTYASARDFLDRLSADDRGCLLLDMRMPGISGIDLQERLNQKHITMPVIFISGHVSVQSAVQAMKSGALEVLQKPFNHDQLLSAVNKALVLDESQFAVRHKQQMFIRRMQALTDRERQVMDQMITGASNKEIGRSLNLSPRTVETHRAHVIQKLGVKSIAELVEHTLILQQKNEIFSI